MGTIASVLQWNCGKCGKINATERTVCFNCAARRPDEPSSFTNKSATKQQNHTLSRSVSQNHESYNVFESNLVGQQLKHSTSYTLTSGN